MSGLRLDLDTTDFERLFELGRSLIPATSPSWTDHNTHDPGIMLVELLAFAADAQVYALGRTRVDERVAFARLLGLERRGPTPARATVWPLLTEERPTAGVPFAPGTVVKAGDAARAVHPMAPGFQLAETIRLTSARLVGVSTTFADGTTRDFTRANGQPGATFQPFGDSPMPGDTLALRFAGPLADPGALAGDRLSLGVQLAEGWPRSSGPLACGGPRLALAIRDADGERALELAADTTAGLWRSGVLLVPLGAEASRRPTDFTLLVRSATGGFLRAPRLHRVDTNVLPVLQRERALDEEPRFGTGRPDQSYTLQRSGLIAPDPAPLAATMIEDQEPAAWEETARLLDCGPADRRFELDRARGVLRFGNGVNGRAPRPGATLQLDYPISEGSRGNLPPEMRWTIAGIAGVYGSNPEAAEGGADGQDLPALQTASRQRTRQERPIVTAGDLDAAARGYPDLGVQRSAEAPADPRCGELRGSRTLVVVGPRDPEQDLAGAEKSDEWLAELRARLLPRLPLGQRLRVIRPRYVNVRVTATLVAAPQVAPHALESDARAALAELFALVPRPGRDPRAVWPFGRDVTPLSVKGKLRGLAGVLRLGPVRLFEEGRDTEGRAIAIGPLGLPRLQLRPGDLTVERAAPGAAR
jgi:hypothetical protein